MVGSVRDMASWPANLIGNDRRQTPVTNALEP